MRLLRPYIPLGVRLLVVLRQIGADDPEKQVKIARKWGRTQIRLEKALEILAGNLGCPVSDLRLDHDPALGSREKVWCSASVSAEHVGYVPDANDPEHLVYREKHDHHIKTNVRGEGAQHPDRVLIKKERRRARGVITSSPQSHKRELSKRQWPKRKLKSRSNWPTGRKIPSRRKR